MVVGAPPRFAVLMEVLKQALCVLISTGPTPHGCRAELGFWVTALGLPLAAVISEL